MVRIQLVWKSNMFLVIRSIATLNFGVNLKKCKQNFGYQANSDIYLVPIDMSNLLFKAIRLKIPIPGDDLQYTCRMLS